MDLKEETAGEIQQPAPKPKPHLDLEVIFAYHAPKPGQPEKYTVLREKAKELAKMIQDLCPGCAEQTLAIRKVEEAIFYANASIAREGK